MLHTTDINNEFTKIKFVDWFIRKNRDGELGKIPTEYEGDYLRWHEKQKINGTWSRVTQNDIDDIIDIENDLPF